MNLAVSPDISSSVASTSNEPAIEVRGLSKDYTSGIISRRKISALTNVSFQVNRGEIFGLLGPNGAGKTTFLKIMLGIIRKSAGQATLLGFPAGHRLGRQRVGYLPEHLRVPRHLTGYQALEFFGNLSNVPTSEIRKKRGGLLETVGLAQRARDNVKQYSKGMLQRLGLAQALLHEPELLVLDEPTDGLDPRARAEMREIIRNLQTQGVTIFLNSHLLQEVEMICDRVAILDKGKLRFCGDVDSVDRHFKQSTNQEGDVVAEALITVELSLVGSVDAANQCLQSMSHDRRESRSGSLDYVVRAKDQAEIDQLVDRLRSAGLSLVALTPSKMTLEDAFLKIVDEKSFKN
ncbi:MAG: ABC transporter ATP-binding protein [Planctomycetota bacterium]